MMNLIEDHQRRVVENIRQTITFLEEEIASSGSTLPVLLLLKYVLEDEQYLFLRQTSKIKTLSEQNCVLRAKLKNRQEPSLIEKSSNTIKKYVKIFYIRINKKIKNVKHKSMHKLQKWI